MEQSFPKRPFRTHGGAHVPHHKNTAHTETHVMPPPDEITLPMTCLLYTSDAADD